MLFYRHRKLSIAVASLVMLSLLITACSPAATPAAPRPPTAAPDKPTDAPAAKPTEPPPTD